jgi:hypothetical protein
MPLPSPILQCPVFRVRPVQCPKHFQTTRIVAWAAHVAGIQLFNGLQYAKL